MEKARLIPMKLHKLLYVIIFWWSIVITLIPFIAASVSIAASFDFKIKFKWFGQYWSPLRQFLFGLILLTLCLSLILLLVYIITDPSLYD